RARIDCLSVAANGRVLIVDYKTAVSAEPRTIDRVVQDRGYHQQMDWYMAGVMELGLAKAAPVPLLIVQEKTPPYVVTVSQISRSFLDMADVKNRAALELYALCSRTGHWPGYAEDVVMTTPPPWAERQFQEELDLGRYDIKGKAAA
ncbi:PD-(D/E)XK nuclease-like domain-containing protein, partial [Amycolatopsis vancoresmycina]